ncbi:hypothetical protein ACP4OV_015894 [Aristida adscensionis]
MAPYLDPYANGDFALVSMEDGGLIMVGLCGYSLNLWSLDAIDPDGFAMLTHPGVIKLGPLLPDADSMFLPVLVGFAEAPDSNFIFLNTHVGVFMIGLESLSVRKVCDRGTGDSAYDPILPYMSFFTPDHAV